MSTVFNLSFIKSLTSKSECDGGGGGGGGGDAAVFVVNIDQFAFPQEYTLNSYTSYSDGDVIFVNSHESAFGAATVDTSDSDTISGASSITIPLGGTAVIKANGTSDFELINISPGYYIEIEASGGDEVELPLQNDVLDNTIVVVKYSTYGSGDPVTIVAASGDNINYDGTPTISNYPNRAFFYKIGGNWDYMISSADGPMSLVDYALTISPAHVWFGREDPFEDLVGIADFTNATGMQQVPPIPVGVDGMLISNPSTTASAEIASANFTMHRNANRSFVWCFRIHESDAWGDTVLTTIGSYTDAGGLCSFRTNSGSFYLSTCIWSSTSGTVIDTTANILGKTVLVVGKFTSDTGLIEIRVSIDGGAWNDKSLTNSDSKTSTDASWGLGYNNTYAGQVAHFFAAFWNGWNAYLNADSFKEIIWP